MGSTSGSESENECNTESKELHHSVRDGLFTSKEEYEAAKAYEADAWIFNEI